MSHTPRAGRPRVSSRETLADAACELFLEQGFEATTVAEITQRAGVSRSSFFNYFASKSDLLWSALDERIDQALTTFDQLGSDMDYGAVCRTLAGVLHDFAPDALALAIRNASAMQIEEELIKETAIRQAKLAAGIAEAARRVGIDEIAADMLGAAYAAALLSTVRVWAMRGAGNGTPETLLLGALGNTQAINWGWRPALP